MADQKDSLFPITKHMDNTKHSIQSRINDWYKSKSDINYMHFKDQFNISDNDSINKSDFKSLLPKLFELASTPSKEGKQAMSLLLLQIILFNDWKLGKSVLTESALKASLIEKLISINETTNEFEINELVSTLYLLLCFVVADDNKNVRKSLLLSDNLMINWTIRTLEKSNNENQIKDSLILLQFYIHYSKDYKTISPVLSPLTRSLENKDLTIMAHTLCTLMVFSLGFREARIALIDSKIGKKLVELWEKYENEEQIIKPIFAIIKSLLSRFNDYKNQFLSKELNILQIIPKLADSSVQLNKIYANEIIQMLAMKPISAKHYSPVEQINTIIKYKSIESVVKLLQTEDSVAIKISALNAIFTIAFNSNLDQLKKLVEQGCLTALCSQLETNNENILKLIVSSISVFLMEEFKDILKNQYIITNPLKGLTAFATIIKDCGGFNRLCHINRDRIERESQFNKHLPEWKHKEKGYKLNDTERILEEILVLSFGVETRPDRRKPDKQVMNQDHPALISCCDCKNALATTDIFTCKHVTYCQKCASSAVHKVYSQSPKKCSVEDCDKSIPVMDCPYYLVKVRLYKEYLSQQTKIEKDVEPVVHK